MSEMLHTTLGDLIAAIYDAVSDAYGESPYTGIATSMLLGQLLVEVVPTRGRPRRGV